MSARRDTAAVLGCAIDRLDMDATVARCADLIDSGARAQHVAINAAKLVSIQHDPKLREIVSRCAIVSADGQAVVWAARLLGEPLPERVAGIDLMERLLELAEDRSYRVFFLGARQEVLDEAVRRIAERHPRLEVAGARNGYFDESESPDVSAEIRAARPDILFVAMSSPRKEYWLGKHVEEIGVAFAMGVGGALDVVAGVTRRAPAWMQRAGLEWLFRLLQEPRRMWRRYLVTNVRFFILVARELARRPRRVAGATVPGRPR